MINNDRIVQVTNTDLISLYALILALAGTTVTALDATDPEGDFEITEAPDSGSYVASEPVQTLDIDSEVSAVSIYFVAAYDYSGFSIGGTAVVTAGDDVTADGRTLYKATLSSGTVTIEQQGL